MKIWGLVLVLAVVSCKNSQKESALEKKETTEATTSTQADKNDVGSGITLITPEEAEKLMQLENTQLVDVRTVEELESGKIAGAVNFIYEKNFEEKIAHLDKTQPVIVYCHSGRRSAICAEILKEAGFEKIYDMDGGITQWKKEGRPVVNPE